MKKLFMLLLTMLSMVQGVHAQSNTYTMVIEMQNGTKITIGPNEVKNVSFNNGEVIFSGATLESLIDKKFENVDGLSNLLATIVNEKLQTVNKQISDLAEAGKSLSTEIKDIKTEQTTVKADLTIVQKQIADNLTTVNKKFDDAVAGLSSQINVISGKVNDLSRTVSANNADITTINGKLNELGAKDAEILAALESAKKQLQAADKAATENLTKAIDRISANEAAIKKLMEDIKELVGTND